MSDRVKGLTVVLEYNLKDEDVEPIVKAILQLRSVISVATVAVVPSDYIEAQRLKSKLYGVLMAALYPAQEQL